MELSPRSKMLSRRDKMQVSIRRESVNNLIKSKREENIKWRLEKQTENQPAVQSLTQQQFVRLLAKEASLLDREEIKKVFNFISNNPHNEELIVQHGVPLAQICLEHYKLQQSLELMGTLGWKNDQIRGYLTSRGAVRKCIELIEETKDKTSSRLIVWVLCSLAEGLVNFEPFVIVAQRYQTLMHKTKYSSQFFLLLSRLATLPQLLPDSQYLIRQLFHTLSTARQLKRNIILTTLGEMILRMRSAKIIPYLNQFLSVCDQLSFKRLEHLRNLGRRVLARLFETAGELVVQNIMKSDLIKSIIESTSQGNIGQCLHNLRIIRVFFQNLCSVDLNQPTIELCVRYITNILQQTENAELLEGCLVIIGDLMRKTTELDNLARLLTSQFNMASILQKVMFNKSPEVSQISQAIYYECFRNVSEF